jgi:hypothetical protein
MTGRDPAEDRIPEQGEQQPNQHPILLDEVDRERSDA